jgi:hypothetical protein
MNKPRPNRTSRLQPAAEQAAHPNSGPRRRPRELSGSFVTHDDSGRPTHSNRPPRFPVRFSDSSYRIRAVQLGTVPEAGSTYAHGVIPIDRTDRAAQVAHIDRWIEEYRAARRRQRLRRAIRLWRKAEVHQRLAPLEVRPARVH